MAQEYATQYQWIKGDKTGNTEIFAEAKNEWIYFQSGKRINVDLINEFMLPFDGTNKTLQPNANAGIATTRAIPAQQGSPGTSSVNSSYSFESADDSTDDFIRDAEGNVYNSKPPVPQVVANPNIAPAANSNTTQLVEPVKEVNPVTLLINKSKKDKVELSIKIELELPNKNVYDIISDSFEVDLNEEIANNILDGITNKELKNKFKEALEEKLITIYK